MRFIELLFGHYGSDEYLENAPTVRAAATEAGLGSYWAACKIVQSYLERGCSFR